ncbi:MULTISPECIES: septal ring lytic transglycosylase RlpA family protein [Rufibacter]|uniref:Probable endolytic peptidoglycan transglycosylase RlpA n=1 Tax=Rufibacter quisquiliarum TaxID=1549639 RepID=A0A839GQQ5_9BACT|nr:MULTISPECIES: septal ring lytic transglycosylase RlpA family protein [Rufibacter]MBA9076171.1 rare lipoprotein A [Rufibacter quisquiliarum]
MGKLKIYYAIAVLFILFFGIAPLASAQEVGETQSGTASWYGSKYHGRRTSSGEVYNRHKLTAAHNGLPLGTKVKVTNLTNGESVVVKINDRGPFRGRRIIDLSEAAAKRIHYRSSGLTEVKVEVLELPEAFLAARAKKAEAENPDLTATAEPVTAETTPLVVAAAPVQQQLFVVQAGAFGNQANAEAQAEKLRKIYQKLPISLVEETVNGKKVHRIIAGRFNSRLTAEQARKDFAQKGVQGLVKVMAEPAPIASTL